MQRRIEKDQDVCQGQKDKGGGKMFFFFIPFLNKIFYT